MSARFNWMNFALGVLFVACLLIAVLYGGYQRDKAVQADNQAKDTTKQVAFEVENLKQLESSYVPLITKLGAADDGREDADFFALLQSLMRAANVIPVQQQRVALELLPTIGTGTEPVRATASSSTASSEAEKAKLNEPSLTNLPLQARAVTTRVEVQGNYTNLRNFIGQVHNFRYKKRAININSMQIGFADDKGNLRAVLNLTRFIYPKGEAEPIRTDSPLSEEIRKRESSSALMMSRPDQPAPVRSGN